MKKFIKIIICVDFVKKKFSLIKIRDHCHLKSNYRGPALSKCNLNVTQKQSNVVPFIYDNFGSYDCHMLLKILVVKKNDKV